MLSDVVHGISTSICLLLFAILEVVVVCDAAAVVVIGLNVDELLFFFAQLFFTLFFELLVNIAAEPILDLYSGKAAKDALLRTAPIPRRPPPPRPPRKPTPQPPLPLDPYKVDLHP